MKKLSIAKTIKYIKKQIPTFKCKPSCTDCCGVIVMSRWEWDLIEDKRTASGLTCPYASEKGCEIYEQRPILCRLYGVVKKMQCPHGCSNKILSAKKEAEIIEKYNQILAIGSVRIADENRN